MADDTDAIAAIHAWHAASPFDITLCEAAPGASVRALSALPPTADSMLRAVVTYTGGILVDGGWLRVLGAGCALLPRAIDTWNVVDAKPRCAAGLLIADDVLGGFYARLDRTATVHYLAPDTGAWEDLACDYADWLAWAFSPALESFYAELRWPTWRDEVAGLGGNRAIHIYPPLLAEGLTIAERNRRAVTVEELWNSAQEMSQVLESSQ